MVGAVEVSGFGVRVGADGEAELLGHGFNRGIEIVALGAGDFDFFGRAEGRDVIEIQVERHFPGGNGRMLAEIFGTEQSLLFCGHGRENHRATGAGLSLRENARQLQHDTAAGGVVAGAVVNVVSWHFGADAEVVIVRGVDDGFVFQFGIRAGEHADYVV